MHAIEPRRTALLTIDLQNDFLHPDGAYGRAGQNAEAIAALPERLRPIVGVLRKAGGRFVSAQFTLVPLRGGEPLIAAHLKALRPFLKKGDFEPGSFGHALVDELQPADVVIEKVAYSAFYQTRLEYVLQALEIDTLAIAGIVTNGGVASTVRDAHMRGYKTILLSDGTAAFRDEVHEASLLSLESVTEVLSCEDLLRELDT